jgi:hypothetical protein
VVDRARRIERAAHPQFESKKTMAKHVITVLTDDLDGGDADRTLELGLDGVNYTIDRSRSSMRSTPALTKPPIQRAAVSGPRRRGSGSHRSALAVAKGVSLAASSAHYRRQKIAPWGLNRNTTILRVAIDLEHLLVAGAATWLALLIARQNVLVVTEPVAPRIVEVRESHNSRQGSDRRGSHAESRFRSPCGSPDIVNAQAHPGSQRLKGLGHSDHLPPQFHPG